MHWLALDSDIPDHQYASAAACGHKDSIRIQIDCEDLVHALQIRDACEFTTHSFKVVFPATLARIVPGLNARVNSPFRCAHPGQQILQKSPDVYRLIQGSICLCSLPLSVFTLFPRLHTTHQPLCHKLLSDQRSCDCCTQNRDASLPPDHRNAVLSVHA